MSNVFTGHALCQALKLEGVSDRAEANIESQLRRLWENNGPDFMIDYVKILKSDTEASLVNPNHVHRHQDGEISVAWNHKLNRPKGPLSYLYKRFPKPEERIRVIGAVYSAVTYEEATPKQIDKFEKNLLSTKKATFKIGLGDKFLYNLERNLERRVRQVKRPFGHLDLTNNSLPFAQDTVFTAQYKQDVATASLVPSLRSSNRAHRAILELDSAMKGQFYTAPRISKTRWNQILDLAYHGDEIPKGVKYPSKITPRPYMARDYEVKKCPYGPLCLDVAEDGNYALSDYVGRLDFLQKPGGKLRSVANINRFVNYTMDPYAQALEDSFYPNATICVKDQKEGLRWAQSQLRQGKKLTSLDLTAATDTLDFRVFTRELKRDFPGKTGLLETYATYFEELSSLPLWCETLDSPVQFETGQPLGMKGSFQTLTAMNRLAGFYACQVTKYPDGCFRIVGDDFVCHSEIAPAYNAIIERLGGSTNVEKAMESDRYAEFLSHIVTKDNVYITKPKYRPGNKALFSNLEKAKVRDMSHIYHLTPDEKNAVDIMSQYSVDEMDFRNNLPHLRSKDLSMDSYSLEVMSTALQLVTELKEGKSREFEISDLALDFLYLEDPTVLERTHAPVINNSRIGAGPEIHEGIATVPTGTSVYDHRTGRSEPKISYGRAHKDTMSKASLMKKIDDSLNTEKTSKIDIGYGQSVDTDEVVLAAMQEVDNRQLQNRQQATREKSERRIPNFELGSSIFKEKKKSKSDDYDYSL